LEVALLAVGVVTELMAQDAETTGRIAEPIGDLGGRQTLDEVSPKGLVLSLERLEGLKEEPGFL
jgi:hypothetical protein